METEEKITDNAILDLVERGFTPTAAAELLEMPVKAVKHRIAKLQHQQPILLQYRKMHNLHLTKLQHDILSAISEEDIANASLGEKVKAYKTLKDAEMLDRGGVAVDGLLHYLTQLEEERVASLQPINIIDVEPTKGDLPAL